MGQDKLAGLINPHNFPERTAALKRIHTYNIIEVHDDGDLTIEDTEGKFYVVTTDGQVFEKLTMFQAKTEPYDIPFAQRLQAEMMKEMREPFRGLLTPVKFPKRDEALKKLGKFTIADVHSDGDLTVRSQGKLYVVTTDGEIFEQTPQYSTTVTDNPTFVSLWTGKIIPVKNRDEAVEVVKDELKAWMQKGDRLIWYNTDEDDRLGRKPSFAVVVNEVGEQTDAAAMIVYRRSPFKPGEIVLYKGEKVRVDEHVGDRVAIWIPSRQEQVWVTPDKLQIINVPQTKTYWVKIKDPGSSSFTRGAVISYEEFQKERKRILERGEKPPSIEIPQEASPDNGNGGKHLPATIEGEPIPEKYRELIPFVDAPLPPWSDFLLAVVPEESERKIDVVLQKLKDGVEQIQGSEQFRLFLTTMSKFHDYSVSNLILILIQRPGATRVAGFTTWKNLGRWVKRGERGIAILAPVMAPKLKKENEEEEEEVELAPTPVYFKVVHVFDVSQTEGKPLPEFEVPVLTGEANEALFANVIELAKSQGIEVSFEPREYLDASIKGQYSAPRSIWVRPEESRAQQLKSLIHEMAHYYSEGVFRIPRRDAETIAESAAFTVGAHYGFDSGVRSFPYVALWAQDKKILAQNLSSIRKVADTILHALETAPKKFLAVTPSGNGKKSLQVGDRVKSKAWRGIEGYPWLTVKGVYTTEWMEKPMLEVEVTDGVTTNRVFEDTIIAHEPKELQLAVGHLPDSSEFLTYTIENSGQREALDKAFTEAIARVRK